MMEKVSDYDDITFGNIRTDAAGMPIHHLKKSIEPAIQETLEEDDEEKDEDIHDIPTEERHRSFFLTHYPPQGLLEHTIFFFLTLAESRVRFWHRIYLKIKTTDSTQ